MPKLGEVSTLAINPAIKNITGSIIAFVPTAVGFAAIRSDQQLQTFDASGKPLGAKSTGSGGMVGISALVARPDGEAVLTGTTKITQYDAATAKPGLQYKGHGGKTEVTGLVYLSDGRLASSALVNIATKANSVCIWAEDGALLHTIHLPSGGPKRPCQPQRLVRAGTTDTLIAVGWAPSDGTPAIVPALHLFRIDPSTQEVTRIATLWDGTPLTHTSVESIAATDDRVILTLHSSVDAASRDPKERTTTTEIRVLDLEGKIVASNVSAPRVGGGYAPSYRAVAVSADGTMVATVIDAIELRAFPSLELLDRIEDLPLDTVPRFAEGALLFATSKGIFRAPIG